MKQEMSSVDVAAIIKELSPRLMDSKISKIYQHSENEFRIGLHIFKEGRTNLVIEAGKRFHLTKYPQSAPKFPQAFPMILRKYLSGGRITKVLQYDFDRIIEMHIKRGEDETILIIELFSKGNIVLLDSEKRIILPLKSINFKDRKIIRGEIYDLPQPQISPITASKQELIDMFSNSDADIVRTVASKMNIGGQYSEEICNKAGIDKKTSASKIGDISNFYEAMQKVFSPLNSELKPHIILKDGKKIDVLPFQISQYEKYEKQEFKTFNEALDEYFSQKPEDRIEEKKEEKKEKLGVFEYRLQKQKESLEKFRIDEKKFVHKGELIYANYNIIDGILKAISTARNKSFSWDEIKNILKKSNMEEAKLIKSINSAKGLITVNIDNEHLEIDIRLTVPQNSQVYYNKAKKFSSKIKGAIEAIKNTEELSKKNETPKTKQNFSKQKEKWYEKFRWFFSSDGFLIIGGKDADSNEEIVKKYMEKRDIFFHAHVSGSPAVIIKTEGKEIPETTLFEAAQFTVSYSGIWKSGQASGECYWVYPEQVSKTPESGEYVAKGAFVIRGKRNYFKDIQVATSIGIENENKKLIGGPLSAVSKKADFLIEIEQGEFNQNDLSKKIYRILNEKFEDKKLVKLIAPIEKIVKFLPSGNSKIKNQ